MKKTLFISILFHSVFFLLFAMSFFNAKPKDFQKIQKTMPQKTITVSFYVQPKPLPPQALPPQALKPVLSQPIKKNIIPKNIKKTPKSRAFQKKKIILKTHYPHKIKKPFAIKSENIHESNPVQKTQIHTTKQQNNSVQVPSQTPQKQNNNVNRFNENDYIHSVKQQIARHKFYPNSAKRRSIEGRVGLAISIDKNGGIIALSVTQSSGSHILDTAALQSVYAASPFGVSRKIIKFSFGIKFDLKQ